MCRCHSYAVGCNTICGYIWLGKCVFNCFLTTYYSKYILLTTIAPKSYFPYQQYGRCLIQLSIIVYHNLHKSQAFTYFYRIIWTLVLSITSFSMLCLSVSTIYPYNADCFPYYSHTSILIPILVNCITSY